jgi:hypothetical protein
MVEQEIVAEKAIECQLEQVSRLFCREAIRSNFEFAATCFCGGEIISGNYGFAAVRERLYVR